MLCRQRQKPNRAMAVNVLIEGIRARGRASKLALPNKVGYKYALNEQAHKNLKVGEPKANSAILIEIARDCSSF
jgi:hypothetical protein